LQVWWKAGVVNSDYNIVYIDRPYASMCSNLHLPRVR